MTHLRTLSAVIHQDNCKQGFWDTRKSLIKQGEALASLVWVSNIGLIHSEECEAFVGAHNNLLDDHLPALPSAQIETADALIRCMDMIGFFEIDIPSDPLTHKLVHGAISEIMDLKPEYLKEELYIQLYEMARKTDIIYEPDPFIKKLMAFMNSIMFATFFSRTQIVTAILAKLEYNRTRPVRHGKLS